MIWSDLSSLLQKHNTTVNTYEQAELHVQLRLQSPRQPLGSKEGGVPTSASWMLKPTWLPLTQNHFGKNLKIF